MITNTSLYKFASGEMKGRPLDEKGLSWQIATRGGHRIACFSDGTTVEYYIEGNPLPRAPARSSSTGGPMNPKVQKPKRKETAFSERILKTQSVGPLRSIVSRYKLTATGTNPTNPLDPVYAVHTNIGLFDYDRATVGTGLREFLWLYAKLRELGRVPVAALFEAWQIYFL